MDLSMLKVSRDTQQHKERLPKEPTPFERKRAVAETYEDLVRLGYEEGMHCPEAWAEHVLNSRLK